jgi:hypothetical protein
MKKSRELLILMVLELIALGSGAYMYAVLNSGEHRKVLIATGLFCVLAGMVGIIVTRSRARATSVLMLVMGVLSLSIGIFFLTALNYHERAYTVLGIGILCLLGGLAAILMPRSPAVTFTGLIILGLAVLGFAGYSLMLSGYQGRVYLVLGVAAFCLLAGLVGVMIVHTRSSIEKV